MSGYVTMENLKAVILDVLAKRKGGDLVESMGRCLPDDTHHMKAVAQDVAFATGNLVVPKTENFMGFTLERRPYPERRWQRQFYVAVRQLSDDAFIEFDSRIRGRKYG